MGRQEAAMVWKNAGAEMMGLAVLKADSYLYGSDVSDDHKCACTEAKAKKLAQKAAASSGLLLVYG